MYDYLAYFMSAGVFLNCVVASLVKPKDLISDDLSVLSSSSPRIVARKKMRLIECRTLAQNVAGKEKGFRVET